MLGFRPVGQEAAAAVEDSLVEADKRLAKYESAWDSLVDSWLVIRIEDPQVMCLACLGVVFYCPFVMQQIRFVKIRSCDSALPVTCNVVHL